jgi:hypothetical protein
LHHMDLSTISQPNVTAYQDTVHNLEVFKAYKY